MPSVSIVLPVFNAAVYLSKCLDSLLSQTLPDIEVIVVDDGSSDGSYEIASAYRSKDPRLKLILTGNGGVSKARNIGIEASAGEYVGFADADDWVEPGMFEDMYRTSVLHDLDVCLCGFFWEYPNKDPLPADLDLPDNIVLQRETIVDKMVKGSFYSSIFGPVWKQLIKRSVLTDNGIRFCEHTDFREDDLFNLHLYYHSQKVMYIKRHYYHYRRMLPGSLTGRYRKNYIRYIGDISSEFQKFIENHRLDSNEYRDCYELGMCFLMTGYMMNIANRDNPNTLNSTLDEVKRFLDFEKIQDAATRINNNSVYLKNYRLASPLLRFTYRTSMALITRKRAFTLYTIFLILNRFGYLALTFEKLKDKRITLLKPKIPKTQLQETKSRYEQESG